MALTVLLCCCVCAAHIPPLLVATSGACAAQVPQRPPSSPAMMCCATQAFCSFSLTCWRLCACCILHHLLVIHLQVRVLLKSPKGPEVSPTDVFSYNAGFSNPLFRIKVNNIQMKETQEENAKTNAEVGIDTQHATAAARCRRGAAAAAVCMLHTAATA